MVASIATAKAETLAAFELSNQARLHSIAMLNAGSNHGAALSGQLADGELSDFAWNALQTPGARPWTASPRSWPCSDENEARSARSIMKAKATPRRRRFFKTTGQPPSTPSPWRPTSPTWSSCAAAAGSAPGSRGGVFRPFGEIVARVGAELERAREQAIASRGAGAHDR